jgi:hypothetical protein
LPPAKCGEIDQSWFAGGDIPETKTPAGLGEAAPKHDFGVLFVHGIGNQKQGRTLIQFGEPLFRWLFRWLGNGTDPGGDTSNRTVNLTKVELQPGAATPAHCFVSVELPAPLEAPLPPQRWLLAESWWTDVFNSPPFTKLAFWLLSYVPWLGLDFIRRVYRRVRTKLSLSSVMGLLSLPLLLLIGPIVVLVLIAVIAVLLILYALPIPLTKDIAQKVGVALAQSVGDSFIVIQSPIDHGAMIQRIERDLAWLSERCNKIAIVSHSQGAALSHEILAASTPSSVKLFLSVGSAVRRLADIRQLRLSDSRWQVPGWLSLLAGALLLIVVAAGTVVVLGGSLNRWPSWAQGWSLAIGLFIALVLLLVAYRLVGRAFAQDRPELLLSDRGTGLRWVDCFATADPVPNGPLIDGPIPIVGPGGERLAPYAAIQTFNHRWMLTDHVTYSSNLDQFVTRMANELASTAGLELTIGPEDDERLNQAEELRKKRTSWLSAFRTLFIGAAILMIGAIAHTGGRSPRTSLADIARAVREGTPDWVTDVLTFFITPFETVLNRLRLSEDELLGAMVLLLVLAATYGLVIASWSFWDRRDMDRLFQRTVRLRTLGAALFGVLASAAIIMCVLVVPLYS